MKRDYKRRRYFVDRMFQTKFIAKFCLAVIITSLLAGGLIFFLSRNSTTVAIENTRVVVKRTADFIFPVIVETVLVVSFFAGLVVLLMTLFISHKIVGPLVRLKRETDFLKDGDLRRNFSVRTKDQLRDLSKSLNLTCDALREKHKELQEKYNALRNFLQKDMLHGSTETKEELARILRELNSVLNYFKV